MEIVGAGTLFLALQVRFRLGELARGGRRVAKRCPRKLSRLCCRQSLPGPSHCSRRGRLARSKSAPTCPRARPVMPLDHLRRRPGVASSSRPPAARRECAVSADTAWSGVRRSASANASAASAHNPEGPQFVTARGPGRGSATRELVSASSWRFLTSSVLRPFRSVTGILSVPWNSCLLAKPANTSRPLTHSARIVLGKVQIVAVRSRPRGRRPGRRTKPCDVPPERCGRLNSARVRRGRYGLPFQLAISPTAATGFDGSGLNSGGQARSSCPDTGRRPTSPLRGSDSAPPLPRTEAPGEGGVGLPCSPCSASMRPVSIHVLGSSPLSSWCRRSVGQHVVLAAELGEDAARVRRRRHRRAARHTAAANSASALSVGPRAKETRPRNNFSYGESGIGLPSIAWCRSQARTLRKASQSAHHASGILTLSKIKRAGVDRRAGRRAPGLQVHRRRSAELVSRKCTGHVLQRILHHCQ